VLLGLGLTSTAFAAVAGTLVWAWAPQIGNWTLSPQQDFAEFGKDNGKRDGRAWVPPEMPPITPWNTAQNSDTSSPGPELGEPSTQIASVDAKGSSSGGHGPLDFENQAPPNVDHLFGLFSGPGGNTGSGWSGGQGGSWNGTFNPNGGRARSLGFAPYSPGSSGGSNPPPAPKCPEGQSWNGTACAIPQPQPQTKTSLTTNDGDSNGCGQGQTWNAQSQTCVASTTGPGTGPQSCPENQSWNEQSQTCVANTTGPGTGPQSCLENQSWDEQNQICVANNEPDPEDCPTETPCQIVEDEQDPPPCTGPNCSSNPSIVLVPEPGSMLLFLAGLLGLGWMVRRRA
jgi:hypothetical protein